MFLLKPNEEHVRSFQGKGAEIQSKQSQWFSSGKKNYMLHKDIFFKKDSIMSFHITYMT